MADSSSVGPLPAYTRSIVTSFRLSSGSFGTSLRTVCILASQVCSALDTDCCTAEWSFQYLRRQAQEAREELIQHKVERNNALKTTNHGSHSLTGDKAIPKIVRIGPVEESEALSDGVDNGNDDSQSVISSTSILEGQDVISFRAQWKRSIGRLIVSSSGIRFVRSLPKKELWSRSFLELVEMRKLQGSTVSKLVKKALEQFELTCTDGAILRMEAMKNRDEAFNTIIGFSGLRWQVVHRGPEKHDNGTDRGTKS